MKKIISVVLFLLIQIASYSFEDNYVFNAERIKKVFSEWELEREKNEKSYFMRLYNKKNDIFIDISNYEKGDNPETTEKRI
ncbi:hypothetical protein [Fusobacterium varium]|uniref:hypothetical protein n=1 Tax=Fusobacterium varium TaxID=856 RepID=UPI001F44260F|nr:hypothetical protein [Fusobacterium varium]